MKQSATDPLSGKIDIGILTTGMSSAARKRRMAIKEALNKIVVRNKGKVQTLNCQKLQLELKDSCSEFVSILHCVNRSLGFHSLN